MPALKNERNTECDGSEMFVIMGLKVAKWTNNQLLLIRANGNAFVSGVD